MIERPTKGTITHILNPETELWDRIRPFNLRDALAAAFEAGVKFHEDFTSTTMKLDCRPIAMRHADEALKQFGVMAPISSGVSFETP